MEYLVLGTMSGTSLDGMDLVNVKFWYKDGWKFEVLEYATYSYPDWLVAKLRQAQFGSAYELIRLHKEYGKFVAKLIVSFLENRHRPMLIAFSGHTIFHYPQEGINFQIGDCAVISGITGLPVVCDFRSSDIALGGQGAPLVPNGEKFLFSDYNILINLGGFGNISILSENLAYDICPVNFALNYFARKLGFSYDKDGNLGRKLKPNFSLLSRLNSISYYREKPPKSLSDHWFYNEFLKVIDEFKGLTDSEILATLYYHISDQIAREINRYQGKVLITGGGAKNKFLIELIKQKSTNPIYIPSIEIVDYKEAIIFGFLGLRRWLGLKSCYSQFTGSEQDSSCGAIYDTFAYRNSAKTQ